MKSKLAELIIHILIKDIMKLIVFQAYKIPNQTFCPMIDEKQNLPTPGYDLIKSV